jgi:hypothetical protein
MRNLIPLTRLTREIERTTGQKVMPPFRDVYTLAVDGEIPAEQERGRWYFDLSQVPTIAPMLVERARIRVAA